MRPRVPRRVLLLAVGAGLGAVLGVASLNVAPSKPFASAGCRIKGSISVETGERIYHVPGQKYYTQTVISPNKGERYFRSEWEAWVAGWRRSRV